MGFRLLSDAYAEMRDSAFLGRLRTANHSWPMSNICNMFFPTCVISRLSLRCWGFQVSVKAFSLFFVVRKLSIAEVM